MIKDLKTAMIKDLTSDHYNVIDKEIGYFCDTQQFK